MRLLFAAVAATVLVGSTLYANAQAEPSQALIDAATKEGTVTWYESSAPDQMAPVVEAFETKFPGVKLNHVTMQSFESIGPRILQETQAGLPTADVLSTGGDLIRTLYQRGIFTNHDWQKEVGLTPPAAENEYAVAQFASVFVLLSNTDLLQEDQIPKSWDELLDPKWKGKIAVWNTGYPFALLAEKWGEEAAGTYVDKFATQAPVLFPGTQGVTQAVVSGDVPLGIGLIHTTAGAIKDGAPVRMTSLAPTPVAMNYSAILTDGEHPEAAKLLIWWLASDEGSQALEAATFRGNIYANTSAKELVGGEPIATWPISKADTISRLVPVYTNKLRGQ